MTLEKTMRNALDKAKMLAQRASTAGIDATIEPIPMKVGETIVTMNVLVVRNG